MLKCFQKPNLFALDNLVVITITGLNLPITTIQSITAINLSVHMRQQKGNGHTNIELKKVIITHSIFGTNLDVMMRYN
jgi:hypothetical protein